MAARWFVQCSGVRKRESAVASCFKGQGQNGERSGRISCSDGLVGRWRDTAVEERVERAD